MKDQLSLDRFEEPNTGEGSVQMVHHRVGTAAQQIWQRWALRQRIADVYAKGRQPELFGLGVLHPLAFGDITDNATIVGLAPSFPSPEGQLHGKLHAIFSQSM